MSAALRCLLGRHAWQQPALSIKVQPEPGKWVSATVVVKVCARCGAVAYVGMGYAS